MWALRRSSRSRRGSLPGASLWGLLLLWALATAPARGQGDPAGGLSLAGADERGVLEQLNTIDRELQEVRDRKRAIEDRLAEVQEQIRRHEDEVAVAEAQLAVLRPQVRARVRALYRLHRRGLARMVFGAEDPTDLRRRSVYLMAILQADLDRLQRFAETVAGRARADAAIEEELASMKELRASLQLHEAELVERRAARLAMLGEIRARRAMALGAMDGYRQVQQQLQRDLELASRAQANRINPADNFRDQYGRLPWPANGRLIRRFGPYTDPATGAEMDSLGIEIAAEFGTPFRAVFDGEVKLADFVPGYGQTVAIEHGPYTTIYSHANGLEVRRGDRVRAGDVLGMVGNSGLTDGRGYVLGFEIRYNGTPQDPLPWLAPR